MDISPNGGGGYDVLPDRAHFDTLQEAENYVRSFTVNVITRWQAHCQSNILVPGGQILDGLASASRLAALAQEEIDATEPGAVVPGMTWTKEQANELMALAAHVLTFVQTPISEGGPTPQEIISRYA